MNAGSPAVDAGDAGLANVVCADFAATYGLDICVDPDRQTRPLNGGWDIGAFEQ